MQYKDPRSSQEPFQKASFQPAEPDTRKQQAFVVSDPRSKALTHFYTMLCKYFMPDDIEGLGVLREEMGRNNASSSERFLLTVQYSGTELKSAAYGSVKDGALAIRFSLPTREGQLSGSGYEANLLLIESARDFSQEKGCELKVLFGEFVSRGESSGNRLMIEPGNGMRRLYVETGAVQGRHFRELPYHLPPLEWQTDGSPVRDGPPGHLQVAVAGWPSKILPGEIEPGLRSWWQSWYIRPRADFTSTAAWERHQELVWSLLERETLTALRQANSLVPVSALEREAMSRSGCVFHGVDS